MNRHGLASIVKQLELRLVGCIWSLHSAQMHVAQFSYGLVHCYELWPGSQLLCVVHA